uniref:Solute carrier family 40 member n=1 Tax=Caenorhabditis japonica TaxID=281687 RepID=A0A8R1ED09_CAEJA
MAFLTKKEAQLYGAFLLTTLGDRMWMFVIGLFLNKVGGITWVAAAQLLDSGLKLAVLTTVGQYLDKLNRSKCNKNYGPIHLN